MRYCRRCVTPDTRPGSEFDADGICSACRAHGTRPDIDWSARERDYREVVLRAQRRSAGYDCIVPVSGGKDSTWQVATCLNYGLNPLAVTWRTPGRTALGQANLDNLVSLGVDHIEYQVNPKVERKFVYQALARYGDTAIPMHMALFAIPTRIAVRFGIPLIVWGENSAFEYGGPDEDRYGFKLDGHWLRRYGVMQGTSVRDWISPELTERELTPYFMPSDDELQTAGVLAVFLGYYFPWDPETSLRVATAHGFRSRKEGPKTGYYDYADIDDDFISVHHFLKWYKFGFTRSFDNLSLEIRNGRITRDQAIRILRERGDETPHADIQRLCSFLGISGEHFFEVIERFRNPGVWTRRDGRWVIEGFLIDDWRWA